MFNLDLCVVKITLIDFLPTLAPPPNYEGDVRENLIPNLRRTMMKRSQRTQYLLNKMMVLNQIVHSNVPFIPSIKPNYDFSKDMEVVSVAVAIHGSAALKLLDESMRNDPEILLKASGISTYSSFSERLRSSNWYSLKNKDKTVKNNEKICRMALKSDPRAIRFVENLSVLNDRSLILEMVQQYGLALEFVGNSLKNDREITLEALKQNPNAFRYVSPDLVRDEEISKFALRINLMELEFKSITGKQFKIYADPYHTLRMIRQQLEEERSTEIDRYYRIVHSNRILKEEDDDKTLEELGINSESKLYLVFRLYGG